MARGLHHCEVAVVVAACVWRARGLDGSEALAQRFEWSRARGFLLPRDPIVSLPEWLEEAGASPGLLEAARSWDREAGRLPSLVGAMRTEDAVAGLAEVDADALEELSRLPVEALERAMLDLSFLGHAWINLGAGPAKRVVPEALAAPWCATADALGRPACLTYYSYNACNFRRLDPSGPIDLGNICRLRNFGGGQDEEWFSMVHVSIEAAGGCALAAAVEGDLDELRVVLRQLTARLERMEENCDPYIYNARVRLPMTGWPDQDMVYELAGGQRRVSRCFGETGAQSSLIPALDAALGLSCDDLGTGDDTRDAQTLVPYLLKMRDYMPPPHSAFIQYLHDNASLRADALRNPTRSAQFDAALAALADFRALHLGLAAKFVRQFDPRSDDEVIGTGGTAFMPYLRAHRDATRAHSIIVPK